MEKIKKRWNQPKACTLALLLAGIAILMAASAIPMPKVIDMNDTTYGLHSEVQDFGLGICALAVGLLVFLYLYNITQWGDLPVIKTRGVSTIFLVANIADLILIPGTFIYYSFTGLRGDYPYDADSVGLPIYTNCSIILFFLIPMNGFLYLSTLKRNTKLPAPFFQKAIGRCAAFLFWKIFIDLLVVINLVCLVFFVVRGDTISVFSMLLFLYVLLSVRAAKVNYYNPQTTS